MQPITYGRHSLDATHEQNVALAECYQAVFQEAPWHEWKKCRVCGRRFGLDDKVELESTGYTHCETTVTDFWPQNEVIADFEHLLKLPGASCWLAYEGSQLIGFCCGYPISAGDLEQKLKLEFMSGLTKLFGPRYALGYQDDLGVRKEFQKRGIAGQLLKLRHKDLIAAGVKTGIVRTRQFPEPSVTFTWFTNSLGFKIVARYPGDDGRVILARDYEFLGRVLGIE